MKKEEDLKSEDAEVKKKEEDLNILGLVSPIELFTIYVTAEPKINAPEVNGTRCVLTAPGTSPRRTRTHRRTQTGTPPVLAHPCYLDELQFKMKTNQLQRIIRTGCTGHWLNHSKEHCVVGIKRYPLVNRNIDTDVIVAEVRETSRRPDEMYPLLERISPRTRKLELFARMHNTHGGYANLTYYYANKNTDAGYCVLASKNLEIIF